MLAVLPIEEILLENVFYKINIHTVPSGHKLHYVDAMKLWKALAGSAEFSRLGVPTDSFDLKTAGRGRHFTIYT